jgi:1-acyl-sn-glycerol-3-phosphate acyltransferase
MNPNTAAVWTLVGYALVAIALVVRDVRRSQHGVKVWLLYVIERCYIALMFRWRANRRCPFPSDRGALVLANHSCPVDPLLLWMNHHLADPQRSIRVISFIMAREYFDKPGLVGWIARTMRSIPIERDGRDMEGTRAALRLLQENELVGVFPEGGINLDGKGRLKPGNPGIAWLALRAQVPIYPVFIKGTPTVESMTKPFYTRSRVRVVYGEPIDLSAYYQARKSHALLAEVTGILMRTLAELGGVETAEEDRGAPEPRLAKLG